MTGRRRGGLQRTSPAAPTRASGSRPQFALPGETTSVPRDTLAEEGMLPRTAYQLVHDELMLDGNARANLATFGDDVDGPEARRLMAECFDKNMIDKDEYPQTAELERRCVRMLADLWHAPTPGSSPGCSTTGSSEAACSAAWRCCGAGGRRGTGAPGARTS